MLTWMNYEFYRYRIKVRFCAATGTLFAKQSQPFSMGGESRPVSPAAQLIMKPRAPELAAILASTQIFYQILAPGCNYYSEPHGIVKKRC